MSSIDPVPAIAEIAKRERVWLHIDGAYGGVLAIDNALSHEHELVEFTAQVQGVESLTETVVPVGAGLRVAVRDRS